MLKSYGVHEAVHLRDALCIVWYIHVMEISSVLCFTKYNCVTCFQVFALSYRLIIVDMILFK